MRSLLRFLAFAAIIALVFWVVTSRNNHCAVLLCRDNPAALG